MNERTLAGLARDHGLRKVEGEHLTYASETLRISVVPSEPELQNMLDEPCRDPPSSTAARDEVERVLRSTGTLPAPFPPEAWNGIFAELLRCGVIASGGLGSAVVTAQGSRAGWMYIMRYPASFPFCHCFLFPMLRALAAVPGNAMQGASDTLPPVAARQARAGRVMTLNAQLLDGMHFDQSPAASALGPRATRQTMRWARVLFARFQGTAFRSIGCGSGGTDLLIEHLAPPGGGTYCDVEARCKIGATRTPHASMTRGFDGVTFPSRVQLFWDQVRLDPVASAPVLLQLRLGHAIGRARRSLAANAQTDEDVEMQEVASPTA